MELYSAVDESADVVEGAMTEREVVVSIDTVVGVLYSKSMRKSGQNLLQKQHHIYINMQIYKIEQLSIEHWRIIYKFKTHVATNSFGTSAWICVP